MEAYKNFLIQEGFLSRINTEDISKLSDEYYKAFLDSLNNSGLDWKNNHALLSLAADYRLKYFIKESLGKAPLYDIASLVSDSVHRFASEYNYNIITRKADSNVDKEQFKNWLLNEANYNGTVAASELAREFKSRNDLDEFVGTFDEFYSQDSQQKDDIGEVADDLILNTNQQPTEINDNKKSILTDLSNFIPDLFSSIKKSITNLFSKDKNEDVSQVANTDVAKTTEVSEQPNGDSKFMQNIKTAPGRAEIINGDAPNSINSPGRANNNPNL